jgi:hypothetical protein
MSKKIVVGFLFVAIIGFVFVSQLGIVGNHNENLNEFQNAIDLKSVETSPSESTVINSTVESAIPPTTSKVAGDLSDALVAPSRPIVEPTTNPVAESLNFNAEEEVSVATAAVKALHEKDLDLLRSVCSDEVTIMRYIHRGNGTRGRNVDYTFEKENLPETFEIEVEGEVPIILSDLFVISNNYDNLKTINTDFSIEEDSENDWIPEKFVPEIMWILDPYASEISQTATIVIGKDYFLLADVYGDVDIKDEPYIDGHCALFRSEDKKLVAIIDIRF